MLEASSIFSCCVGVCFYVRLGILAKSSDGSEKLEVDYKGIVYSFLLSVGNSTIWAPIIETSMKTCYEQFNYAGEGYYCDGLKVQESDYLYVDLNFQ
jgi:hypothetical protein